MANKDQARNKKEVRKPKKAKAPPPASASAFPKSVDSAKKD